MLPSSPEDLVKALRKPVSPTAHRQPSFKPQPRREPRRVVISSGHILEVANSTGKSFAEAIATILMPNKPKPSQRRPQRVFAPLLSQRENNASGGEIEKLIVSSAPTPTVSPRSVTTSNWPSETLASKTRQWVDLTNAIRTDSQAPDCALNPAVAQMYKLYGSMKPLDLVLSVEFCCRCEEHLSLRHDDQVYRENLI